MYQHKIFVEMMANLFYKNKPKGIGVFYRT